MAHGLLSVLVPARAWLVAIRARYSIMLSGTLIARTLDVWRLSPVVSTFGVQALTVDAVDGHVRTRAWSLQDLPH